MNSPEIKTKSLVPAFLSELLHHTRQELIDNNVHADVAEEIAKSVCARMCQTWGGQQIYFPFAFREELSSRDKAIYAEFNGFNHADLATKYRISVQWVYKILERIKAADVASRQSNLEL